MSEYNENREIAIKLSGVKKQYKLGQIGGGTLTADIQSWWARKRGKEDPNTKIGSDQRLVGKTFMALNGIDLTVYKGEALGIIGGNGAGKSTMLKLLSRVTAPSEGEIDIYGRIASMLEVGTGFNGELTGRENIYMNGAILGMTKAEIDAKMEDIIDFSEVREFIDTPVKRYSSGMYVKLAFSVAAHLDSEIMIMDEVLAVGDMAFQKKCLDKMRDAAKKEGRTVLYVSHNMNTIRQLCDRCIVLEQGKIVFEGDVEESINVYLSSKYNTFDTSIDISKSRMDHLPNEILAKMMHIELLNRNEPIYAYDDRMSLDVKVLSHINLLQPCIRLEIRAFDGTPVGAKLFHGLNNVPENTIECFSLDIGLKGLVPGRYKVCLVLYTLNDLGVYYDLDAVYPAFSFEINDSNRVMSINWSNRNWGAIQFKD